MTRHATLRKALADSIIAANIGWTAESVIHRRTTSLFNALATAVATAKNGIVLHIGVTSGTSSDEDDAQLELDVPLTIVCSPEIDEQEEPVEEQLWEDLVKHVSQLAVTNEPPGWQFRLKEFSDIEIQADDGTAYFGRQTIFTKRFNIF
jgi:hypothetical protein